ncbi:MAG: glycosyl hydrolase family 18 protein [Pseudomonadota bacterium]
MSLFRPIPLLAAVLAFSVFVNCGSDPVASIDRGLTTTTPTPTLRPIITVTPNPTPTPFPSGGTATPTPRATSTPRPTATPTPTSTPCTGCTPTPTPTPRPTAVPGSLWVTAYIDQMAAGCFSGSMGGWWTPEYCYASANDIPWDTFSHLVYIGSDIDSNYLTSTSALLNGTDHLSAAALATAGHAHGKPVLLSLLANGNTNGINAAKNDPNTLVNDALAVILANHLDGVDIDIENGSDGGWSLVNVAGDKEAMISLITKMRTAFNGHNAFYDVTKPLIITCAGSAWDAKLWADPAVHAQVDQVNLMTYGMASVGQGKAWHHNAVKSRNASGVIFARDTGGNELPSIQSAWEIFKSRAASNGYGSFNHRMLGVGIGTYGSGTSGGVLASDHLKGITAPYQVWSTAPAFPSSYWFTFFHTWSLSQITSRILDFHNSSEILYDTQAKAPYLSLGSTPSDAQFISFMNGEEAADFAQYLKDEGMGGGIVFQLGYSHLTATNKSTGAARPDRDPFMRALKMAAGIQ